MQFHWCWACSGSPNQALTIHVAGGTYYIPTLLLGTHVWQHREIPVYFLVLAACSALVSTPREGTKLAKGVISFGGGGEGGGGGLDE